MSTICEEEDCIDLVVQDIEVAAAIAKAMIDDPRLGLAAMPVEAEEKALLDRFRQLLENPTQTARDEWAHSRKRRSC